MNTTSTMLPERRMPAISRGAGQGALVGLIPLALLVVGIGVTILFSVVALSLTGSVEFAMRQGVLVAIVIAGLLASTLVYAFACVLALRQVKRWQSAGEVREAAWALWALGVAALVVLLPVLIAVLVPRPAP